MKMPKRLVRIREVDQGPLENWSDDLGRTLAIGDAAHQISVRVKITIKALFTKNDTFLACGKSWCSHCCGGWGCTRRTLLPNQRPKSDQTLFEFFPRNPTE